MLSNSVLADGAELERLRTGKGWSLARLAEQAGLERTSIWYIEHGRPCSRAALGRIALALGVTAADITAPGQDKLSA
jgi:transcriptional regulator with XRE-family HTH domain